MRPTIVLTSLVPGALVVPPVATNAVGAYSQLCTTADTFLLSLNLGILEEKLKPYPFVRVNRSYVVSFEHIDSIEEDVLHIAQTRIPLGKSYRDDFYQRLETL